MRKIIVTLFLLTMVFGVFSVLLLPSFAGAQVSTPEPGWTGLVPCGRNSNDTGTPEDESAPCTLCHLIVGFQRLVQYGMYMVVTLALVGMFFAGVMYMVSSGDESMMTQAKGFLKVSLIGFSVVISAWLIVNVTMWVLGAREGSDEGGVLGLGIKVEKWNKFTCDTTSSQGTGGVLSGGQSPLKYSCDTVDVNGNGKIDPGEGACNVDPKGSFSSLNECSKSCAVAPSTKCGPANEGLCTAGLFCPQLTTKISGTCDSSQVCCKPNLSP